MARPALTSAVRPVFRAAAGALAAIALVSGSLAMADAAVASTSHQAGQRAPGATPKPVRFIHVTRSGNRFGQSTYINNRATNGKPRALLFVTPNWNPGNTASGIYDNHPIGVWYNRTLHRWAIFNQDLATMPIGAAFNVLVLPRATSTAFTVTASASNSSGDSLFINRAVINHHPGAILQVTQNWDPPGHNGVYNRDNVGIWFDGSRWAVFEEDQAAMPLHASFNVLVGTRGTGAGAFGTVVKATHSNSVLNWVFVRNRRTNNNFRAMVFATPNWNPPGSSGVYDITPIGVWYDKAVSPRKWAVFNQITTLNMPVRAAFNLLIFRTR